MGMRVFRVGTVGLAALVLAAIATVFLVQWDTGEWLPDRLRGCSVVAPQTGRGADDAWNRLTDGHRIALDAVGTGHGLRWILGDRTVGWSRHEDAIVYDHRHCIDTEPAYASD